TEEGASEDQHSRDISLLLFGTQRAEPASQQQLLAFDEGFGSLADMVGGSAPGALIERSFAAIKLKSHDGRIEFVELFARSDTELGYLAACIGVGGRRGLELAQKGVDAQPCPLVGFQIGNVAGQQVGALAELG